MQKGEAMLNLMRKDLILNKKLMLINGVVVLAALSFFAADATRTPPHVFAGFASLMVAMLPATMITQEDKFKAMTLGCSLPVSRTMIVQARFFLALALALTGLLVSFLFGALVPFSLYTLGDLFSVRPILTALTLITIFLSLILPFTLRFGMKGLLIFLVVMQVLGVVLLTVARVTQSSLDRRIVEGITGFFRHLREALGPTGFNLAMLAVLLVLFSASYLVSAWSFRNREF